MALKADWEIKDKVVEWVQWEGGIQVESLDMICLERSLRSG